MNDPRDDIAAELGRLRPCEPNETLNRRLEAALDTGALPSPAVIMRPWWFRWAPLAAALVVLAGLAVKWARTPHSDQAGPEPAIASTAAVSAPVAPAEPAPPFRRVNRADYLLDAEDGGLIYTSAGTPWRKVTWQYVSASEWRDERARMTFQVLVPRRETVVIPVPID